MSNLYIIRGIPGSGKSTLAGKLKSIGAIHVEADSHFINPVSGEYQFDVTKLANAHAWCLGVTQSSLLAGKDTIVTNTFTRLSEIRPYLDLARNINEMNPLDPVFVTILVAQGNFKNSHNVPEAQLQRMKTRFNYNLSELYLDYHDLLC
jgi:predicted kinase